MENAAGAVAAEVRATLARHQIEKTAVAEALGLSRSSVSHRLNGRVPFTVAELFVVAGLAGIAPAEFFRGIPASSSAA